MPDLTISAPSGRRQPLRALRRNNDAVVLVEFAYSLPILMLLAFTSIELANLAIANMRVSQIAMTVADNLSRAKQSVPLGLPQLREVDVNDALLGAKIQGGDNLKVLTNGRIVVSSLQKTASGATGKQKIFWQRCKGKLTVASAYGAQGAEEGVTPGFTGMGAGANKVQAADASAIIFAEVTYNYAPLVGSWALGDFQIRREAAFYVRDDRDLSQIYNPSPTSPVADCNQYTDTFT